MSTQLRDLITSTLYQVKAHTLPAVCERFGLEPGTGDEAFQSKTTYVIRRLEMLSDEKVFDIAKAVVKAYPSDELQAAIERLEQGNRIVSDITRHNLAEALNGVSLSGKRDLLEMLRKHFPHIDRTPSIDSDSWEATLADDIYQHAVRNETDWGNAFLLEQVGFLACSQAKLFTFLEDVLYPARRDEVEQKRIADKLTPILRRDGYSIV